MHACDGTVTYIMSPNPTYRPFLHPVELNTDFTSPKSKLWQVNISSSLESREQESVPEILSGVGGSPKVLAIVHEGVP